MKFTEVNINCLEKIFRHLSVDDLLNEADSNGTLKNVVDNVFALKFEKRKVNFRDLDFVDGNQANEHNRYDLIITN